MRENKKRGLLFANPQDHTLILNHRHNDQNHHHDRNHHNRVELFCKSPYQMWVVIVGFKQYG